MALLPGRRDRGGAVMRQTYIDRSTGAIADLLPPDSNGVVLITRIKVPKKYRFLGVGSRLLQRIIDDADREGIDLELWPVPTGGLKGAELVAWYERRGFVRDKKTGIMTRKAKR